MYWTLVRPTIFAVALDPPLIAYQGGLRLFVKASHSCTGPGCVIAANALPVRAVKRADGSELVAGDFVAGQIVCLVDDGTQFQMQNFRGVGGGTGGGTTNNYVINIPYCRDTSVVANQVIAAYTPAITTLVEGMPIEVMVHNATSGPTNILVNALPVRQVIHGDGSQLGPGDGFPGMIWLLFFDGTAWQLVNARGAGQVTGPPTVGSGKSLYFTKQGGYNTFLKRTPIARGNQSAWTISAFMKRPTLSLNDPQYWFCAGVPATSGGNFTGSSFNHYGGSADFGHMSGWWAAMNPLTCVGVDIYGGMKGFFAPALIFQDTHWHHLLWTAQSGGQMSFYYDGVLNSQGAITGLGSINDMVEHVIGVEASPQVSYYGPDIRMCEVYYVDGIILPWSTFASSVSGTMIPKLYNGPWGVNGCYLNWADASDVTPGTLGKDWSGNGNNWTPVNMSTGLVSTDFPPG